jgi:phosphatidate cytidylyltransferase
MILKLYILLVLYFVFGAGLIALNNRNKKPDYQKAAWIKYFVYLLIVNILFGSIIYNPLYFQYLVVFIVAVSAFELFRITYLTQKIKTGLFSLFVFMFLGISFMKFSAQSQNILFYSLYLVTVFDAFSQVFGQLFGRRKLFPHISPGKTFAGFIGGFSMTILTSFFIRDLLTLSIISSVLLGFGMAWSCFVGDLLASFTKRKFGVKDFSNLIPGHGGFLDRFDSFLLASAFLLVLIYLTDIG